MLIRYESSQPLVSVSHIGQINLIVGDYFKCTISIHSQYTNQATELITWLRSKTQVLGMMRDIQIAMSESNQQPALAVIRPVITRWTAHYLAYKRLLNIKWVLENMI
jgi:hypothetical protein